MGLGHSPRIVTDGLVLCLDAANKRSYGGSGTTWTDLKGGNNGTLTNGPTFSSDNGGSIVFDGTDDFVEVSHDSNQNLSSVNGHSVVVWVRWGGTGSGHQDIISKDSEGGTDREWLITKNRENDGREFRPHVWSSVNSPIYTDGSFQVASSVWYQLTQTWDASVLRLYVNGEIDVSISANVTPKNTTQPVRIGGGADGLYSGLHFSGNISYAAIYQKALTADEVRQNYLATKERYA